MIRRDAFQETIDSVAVPLDTGIALRIATWMAIAVAALWLVMSFTYPFGWDQGLFAWVGGVVVHGGIPYRDAWDFKGPLLYYVYALAQAIFGVHLWSIRILDAALLVFATASIAGIVTSLTDKFTGRWTAILFFLWYASHSYWHTAQPDGWAGMVLVIAASPIIKRSSASLTQSALIGFAVGSLTLLKPFYAAFLILPLIHITFSASNRRLAHYASVLLGSFLPVAMMLGWFAAKGALTELIAVHVRYSAMYLGLSPGDRLRGLVEYLLAGRVVAVALPALVYGALVLWNRRRSAAMILAAWTLLVVFFVVLQNRFYAYHWLPILPPASILVAVGLHALSTKVRPLALILCGLIFVHCVAPIALEEARFLSWISGRMDSQTYYEAYGEPGDDMKAVWWLRDHGRPGDIFIFGWNSSVAWLSERQTVSRFGYSLPLMMGDDSGIRSQYRHEALAALKAARPRYILSGTQSSEILGKTLTIDDFPELVEFIQKGYRPAARIGKLTIHELIDDGSNARYKSEPIERRPS